MNEDAGFDAGEPFAPPVDGEDVGAVEAAPVSPDEVSAKPLTDAQVKKMLLSATGQVDAFAGERVGADLKMTDFEAGLIAPGLAMYANSRPAVAAALGGNEYLKAAAGLGIYGVRVVGERADTIRRANAEAEAAQEMPEIEPSPGAHPLQNTGF